VLSGHVPELLALVGVGPWQEVVDLAVEMAVDDFGERVGEIGLRIDAREFAGLDQRGEDRPVFSPAVGAREERILAIECDGTDRALDDVGVHFDAAVVDEAREADPMGLRVAAISANLSVKDGVALPLIAPP
jgi:hypothetical protein